MKKGFTLAELIAVILLLGLLFALIFPRVLEIVEKEEKSLSDAEETLIKAGAAQFVEENDISTEGCVTIEKLYYDNLIPIELDDETLEKVVEYKSGNYNISASGSECIGVSEEESEIAGTSPKINISAAISYNTITLSNKGTYSYITCKLTNSSGYDETKNGKECEFTNLTPGTSYTLSEFCVYDSSNNSTCSSDTGTTYKTTDLIKNSSVLYKSDEKTKITSDATYNYAYKEDISVQFDKVTLAGADYYIKTAKNLTIKGAGGIKRCESNTSGCTDLSGEVITGDSNYIYKITNNSFNIYNEVEGNPSTITLIIKKDDVTEEKIIYLAGIDRTGPVVGDVTVCASSGSLVHFKYPNASDTAGIESQRSVNTCETNITLNNINNGNYDTYYSNELECQIRFEPSSEIEASAYNINSNLKLYDIVGNMTETNINRKYSTLSSC